eukprot:scpid40492/ scgid32298/ 
MYIDSGMSIERLRYIVRNCHCPFSSHAPKEEKLHQQAGYEASHGHCRPCTITTDDCSTLPSKSTRHLQRGATNYKLLLDHEEVFSVSGSVSQRFVVIIFT